MHTVHTHIHTPCLNVQIDIEIRLAHLGEANQRAITGDEQLPTAMTTASGDGGESSGPSQLSNQISMLAFGQ